MNELIFVTEQSGEEEAYVYYNGSYIGFTYAPDVQFIHSLLQLTNSRPITIKSYRISPTAVGHAFGGSQFPTSFKMIDKKYLEREEIIK